MYLSRLLGQTLSFPSPYPFLFRLHFSRLRLGFVQFFFSCNSQTLCCSACFMFLAIRFYLFKSRLRLCGYVICTVSLFRVSVWKSAFFTHLFVRAKVYSSILNIIAGTIPCLVLYDLLLIYRISFQCWLQLRWGPFPSGTVFSTFGRSSIALDRLSSKKLKLDLK